MLSHNELHRIKNLIAFNVKDCVKKVKINQYCVKYIFKDNSFLKIYAHKSAGVAYDENGFKIASHFLQINK